MEKKTRIATICSVAFGVVATVLLFGASVFMIPVIMEFMTGVASGLPFSANAGMVAAFIVMMIKPEKLKKRN